VRLASKSAVALGLATGLASGCSHAPEKPAAAAHRWCDDLPRPAHRTLERVPTSENWFEVYRVADGVFAICEPHQFQEVISYLIVGSERALLFDTGLGIGKIASVVRERTTLPVTVANSHTHFDHVGGNADFDRILAMDTDYTRANAGGFPHAVVAGEVAPEALCRGLPAGVSAAEYRIRPFTPSEFMRDRHRIALGGRELEVLHVPGHTPDATALFDAEAGLLFTGDTFYEGPIWLFVPETDWTAYEKSVARLAALAPKVRRVLPAHNSAVSDPSLLLALRDAVAAVRSGRAVARAKSNGQIEFSFGAFSIVTSKAAMDGETQGSRGGSGLVARGPDND
jgi:glyoxylase-like metal-dependent hydrolase (beta-lactamase superfamily II)